MELVGRPLIPYLYSLAHRAYLYGEPVFPPLVFYYEDDPNVQQTGDEKLIGRDLLVATSSTDGQTARDVYLPRGTWVNYHTNEWLSGDGEWVRTVPLRVDGLFQLPLFVRAGAIIPQMYVDGQTMNALGKRQDGSTHDELIVRVYADEQQSQFTLYEDDGVTTASQGGAVRTTVISQQRSSGKVTVSIRPARGTYNGAPTSRNSIVQIVVHDAVAVDVTLNGSALSHRADDGALDTAESGWTVADGLIVATSGPLDVGAPKVLEILVEQP